MLLMLAIMLISSNFNGTYKNKYSTLSNQQVIISKYSALESVLKSNSSKDLEIYRKANNITKDIILILTNTSKGRDIYSDKIVTLSCNHLKILDSYWLVNSENKFGFSVQAKKWFEEQNFDKLTEKLGWKSDNKQNLPLGYFPKDIIVDSDRQMSRFFSRLKECNI